MFLSQFKWYEYNGFRGLIFCTFRAFYTFVLVRIQRDTRHLAFMIFTLAAALALVLPSLVQHGMFMDGTQYATVSMNYAQGKGSFWFPFLSSTWEKQGQNPFLEHPPLVYFLQSFFFKLFGNGFLAERVYCFVCLLLGACFIRLIWRFIFKDDQKLKDHWWLPILLWIIIPSVFWSYINNMHENTVSVFVLASVYLCLRSLWSSSSVFYVLGAAVCIFLGSFCKGLPALFPVCTFICFKLCFKNITWKRVLSNTLVLLGVPCLMYFVLIKINSDAARSLEFYFKERLLYRIDNNHEVENRLVILFWLLTDLVVPAGLLVIFALIMKWNRKKLTKPLKSNDRRSMIFFFGLIGLCGVLPLSFTHVQRAVYFVPALPFLSIMLSIIFIDDISVQISRINTSTLRYKLFLGFVSFACIIVIGYSAMVFGKISRDEEILNDVQKIAKVVGDNVLIHSSYDIYTEWGFQFYLLRYHQIALDHNLKDQSYALVQKEDVNLKDHTDTGLELSKYKLLKRTNSQ